METASQARRGEALSSPFRPAPRREAAVAVEADFDFLDAAFRDLHARSGATAFQHPVWLDAFYAHVAPARGAEKVVITGRDEEGRLAFVLPMIRRRLSGVRMVESADLGVSDYSAPVIDRNYLPSAAVRNTIAALLRPIDILRIKPVRAEMVDAWLGFLDANAARLDFHAHAASPSAPYDQWRAEALSPGFRSSLDRKARRLAREGVVTLERVLGEDRLRDAIESIRSARRGRFDGDPIQANSVRDFYAEVAVRGATEGAARIYRLAQGGETVGHVFGLTHAGRFHYLLIGCDYERFGRFSPGLIFYDRMMRDWCEEGGEVFDFTIGDEPFKADYATRPTTMWQLSARPTLRGSLAALAAEARDRLRDLRASRAD